MLGDLPLFRGWSPSSGSTPHPTQTDHTPTGGEIFIITVMRGRVGGGQKNCDDRLQIELRCVPVVLFAHAL